MKKIVILMTMALLVTSSVFAQVQKIKANVGDTIIVGGSYANVLHPNQGVKGVTRPHKKGVRHHTGYLVEKPRPVAPIYHFGPVHTDIPKVIIIFDPNPALSSIALGQLFWIILATVIVTAGLVFVGWALCRNSFVRTSPAMTAPVPTYPVHQTFHNYGGRGGEGGHAYGGNAHSEMYSDSEDCGNIRRTSTESVLFFHPTEETKKSPVKTEEKTSTEEPAKTESPAQ